MQWYRDSLTHKAWVLVEVGVDDDAHDTATPENKVVVAKTVAVALDSLWSWLIANVMVPTDTDEGHLGAHFGHDTLEVFLLCST